MAFLALSALYLLKDVTSVPTYLFALSLEKKCC